MSTTIDSKVVEMKFDNKDFEKNTKQSMNTLNNLKKSLDFDDVSKSFSGLEKASKNVKMDGLGGAVDTVKQKFSALEIMAVTALANITNSAVNAGKRMISSLTIEPIKQGFDEYELKMGSVQTIMASTGADIKTVNGYLDELNTYADKTIYSFSDMTASIGKFTNAGVSLDNAVKAIQGISNEAAVSGANSAEASRAMYNFAQALSAGSVKLIDWKSIENANMATVEFKQSLLDTAVAMGTVVKVGDDYKTTTTDANGKVSEAFNATKGFNDALSNQWMTTDVLIQTLSNYSTDIRDMTDAEKKEYEEKLKGIGYTEEQIKSIEELGQKAFDSAQDVKTFTQLMDTLKEAVGSGWSQTFETIFGDFEEAKKLWTAVNNELSAVISNSADSRNALVKSWKELGGRQALFEAIANIWNNIKNVITAVKEGFREIFPPMTGKRLADITKGFRDLTKRLMLSEDKLDAIKRIVRGIAAVFDIFKQAIVAVINGVKSFLKYAGMFGGGALKAAAGVADWLTSLDQLIKRSKIFEKVIGKVVSVIQSLIGWIGNLVEKYNVLGFLDNVKKNVVGLAKLIQQLFKGQTLAQAKKFLSISGYMTGWLSGLISILQKVYSAIKPLWDKITGLFKKSADSIQGAVQGIKLSMDRTGKINTSGLETLANKIKTIFSPFVKVFEGIKIVFKAFWEFLKKLSPIFGKIFSAIGSSLKKVGSALLSAVQNADFEDIYNLLKSGTIVVIGKKIYDFFKKLGDTADEATGLFTNLKDVAGSIKTIFTNVGGAMEAWQKDIQAGTILKIAIAIGILAASLLVLSTIDGKKMETALGAITVSFAELVASMKILNSGTGSFSKAAGSAGISALLISMASAILIISVALKKIGEMDPKQIAAGTVAIITLVTTLTIVSKQLSGSKAMKGAGNLIKFALAILIISSAVKSLAKIDTISMLQGLGGLGAILLELVAFMKLLGKPERITAFGSGLILVASALKIMASVIKQLSKLDPVSMLQGIGGLGALFLELAAFFKLLGKPQKMISFGVGMVFFATSLTILAGALKIIAKMNMEEIGKSLLGLGGSMAILVTSLKVLQHGSRGIGKAAASMLILATAITVVAGAMKIFGSMSDDSLITAVTAMGSAIVIMSAALIVVGSINGLGVIKAAGAMLVLANAILILAPALKILGSMSVGDLIVALVSVAGAFAIFGAAAAILKPIIPTMYALAGAVTLLGVGIAAIGTGIFLFATGLTAISIAGGALVNTIKGLIGLIPEFLSQVAIGIAKFIMEFAKIIPDIMEVLAKVVKSIFKVLKEVVPEFVDLLLTLFIKTLDSLSRHMPKIIDKLVTLVCNVINSLSKNLSKILDTLVNFVTNLIISLGESLRKNIGKIRDAVFGLIIDILASALELVLPWLMDWINGTDKLTESVDVLTESQKEAIAKSYELGESYREMDKARRDSFKDINAEYDYITELKDEYNSLIDENGKIKEGYEKRANTIKITLADAMGMEVSQIEELIGENGKLEKSFDSLMVKMKAEAALEANKDAYIEATKKKKEAFEAYITTANEKKRLEEELVTSQEELKKAEDNLRIAMENGSVTEITAANEAYSKAVANEAAYRKELGGVVLALDENQKAYSGYAAEVDNYTRLMAAAQSGSVKEMEAALLLAENNFITAENGTKTSLQNQISYFENALKEYKEAYKRKYPGVTKEMVDQMETMLSKAKGEQVKFESQARKAAENEGDAYSKTLAGKSSDAETAGNKLHDSAVDGATDKEGEFDKLGEAAAKGYMKGLTGLAKQIYDKAKELGKTAVKGTADGQDSHSPSKEFEKLGNYADLGYVKGIKGFSDKVRSASKDMAEDSLDEVSSVLSKIAAMEDIDSTPTITPVIDLSNVNEGVNEINGIFGGRSLDFASRVNADISAAWAANANGMKVNNKDVVTSINALRKDISAIEDKVGKLQVVMDTGVLVGQIATPIDDALGRKAYLRERGV